MYRHKIKIITLLEAQRMEQINHANGEAAAMIAIADARAKGLNTVAKSLQYKVLKNQTKFLDEYIHFIFSSFRKVMMLRLFS